MVERRHRIERALALLALTPLLVGMGALGWLAAHVATYDALGRAGEHQHHAYMGPLQDGGGLLALLGLLIGVSTCLLARRSAAHWLCVHVGTLGRSTWAFAAFVPAAAMVAVELLDGSLREQSPAVLVLGVLLQAPIGMLVRALVLAVVELVAPLGVRRVPRPAPRVAMTASSVLLPPLAGVMSACAPRRGPPLALG